MLFRLILVVLIVYVLLGMFSRRVPATPIRTEKKKEEEGQMRLEYSPPPQQKKYQARAPRAGKEDDAEYEEIRP